jgi:hypothetical protein
MYKYQLTSRHSHLSNHVSVGDKYSSFKFKIVIHFLSIYRWAMGHLVVVIMVL